MRKERLTALNKACANHACPVKNYKSWPASAKKTLSRLYKDLNGLRQSVIDMIDSFSPAPFLVQVLFDKYFPVPPCKVCSAM